MAPAVPGQTASWGPQVTALRVPVRSAVFKRMPGVGIYIRIDAERYRNIHDYVIFILHTITVSQKTVIIFFQSVFRAYRYT